MEDQVNKKFRPKTKGAGAEKKVIAQKKKKGLNLEPNRGQNPKAFTRPSDGSFKAQAMKQKTEIVERSLRLPNLDVSYAEAGKPPPLLVAVVGPPQSGKSTLIKSLVKMYTNKTVSSTRGPITVVGSKTRRFTLLECPATLHAMCDVAKIADVVLLTVDASFGFEMETFEFLNMAMVHGMPRLIGVLTHLDKLKNNKALKKTKKALRHRFWQEVAQGSKLFYLTGMDKQLYKRKEIVNLNHFLLVTKPLEQKWKAAHSHLLVDRWEDITPEDVVQSNPSVDRDVAFFGYVRGRPLKDNQLVHIPGVGDFPISHAMWVQDPCSMPTRSDQKKKMRTLSTKEKQVYAPMAEIGDLTYDDDAVYVRTDDDVIANRSVGDGHKMIAELQDVQAAQRRGNIEMFESVGKDAVRRSAAHLVDAEMSRADGGDDDDEWLDAEEDFDSQEEDDASVHETPSGRGKRNVRAPKDESDEDDAADIAAVAREDFECNMYEEDVTSRVTQRLIDWMSDDATESIRDMFVTGKWKADEGGVFDEADTKKIDKGYESVTSSDDEDGEGTPGKHVSSLDPAPKKMKTSRSSVPFGVGMHDDLDDDFGAGGEFADAEVAELAKMFMGESSAAINETPDEGDAVPAGGSAEGCPPGMDPEYWRKKQEKKKMFDDGVVEVGPGFQPRNTYYESVKANVKETQEKIETQLNDLAHDTDAKVKLVGFFTGLYVRVVVRGMPVEFTKSLHPAHPLLLGGLLPGEETMGIVYARVKRHRWYRKILKANDPVVLSVGWRRFQTQPIYATEDHTGRQRYLKYTPKHMHCVAAFYAPLMPPNTGVVAIPSNPAGAKDTFRILASGYSMEVAKSSQIVKKLKLIGHPEKIMKNTVFIKDMFTSSAEAAKFEGAKLHTVSGIRGAIKKAMPNKDGLIRASFEDKLLKSDIIFMRTFKKVEPNEYYNPVTNLLTDGVWKGMRTARDLRHDLGIPLAQNPDSEYLENPIHNKAAQRPFAMPAGLTKVVPFSDKVKSKKVPHAIGVPNTLRSELKTLTDVVTDEHEAKKEALFDTFRDIEGRMRVRDQEHRAKRRRKQKKIEAELQEKKDRLMKKFKKEHSKLMAFRQPQKRGRSSSKKE